MSVINEMRLDFYACPENEAFARLVISAFILPLNPTLEEMGDVKTAVSEAVTNSVVHGYEMKGGTIRMHATITDEGALMVEVTDYGVGIEDIDMARQPFYTTLPDMERSGMGFTVMESFMDSVEIISHKSCGTAVKMRKKLATRMPAAKRA